MLRRLSIKGGTRVVASSPSASAPWRACIPLASAPQAQQQWSTTRGMSEAAGIGVAAHDDASAKRKPDWTPGVPAPGREQTLGEAFAAMQHHGRGTRKVKASVLHGILERVSSEEELKYAHLGLELFKAQGIKLNSKAASLFIKACCKAGSPKAAVDALDRAAKYGLDGEGVVGAHRFNYLLSQLYRSGDTENFTRAVAGAHARQQALNPRSHVLITKFEEEERAKREAEEEEERKRKEEEERVQNEAIAAEQAKVAEEERVKQEEEEEKEAAARKKEEEEAAEAAAEAAAVEAAAAAAEEQEKTRQGQEEEEKKARMESEEQAGKEAGEQIAAEGGSVEATGGGGNAEPAAEEGGGAAPAEGAPAGEGQGEGEAKR